MKNTAVKGGVGLCDKVETVEFHNRLLPMVAINDSRDGSLPPLFLLIAK